MCVIGYGVEVRLAKKTEKGLESGGISSSDAGGMYQWFDVRC